MKNFSRVIQRIMAEKQMTQAELATLTGMQQSKISRICNGANRVDRDDLEKVLSAFPEANDRFQIVSGHIQDEVPADVAHELDIRRPSGEIAAAESYADMRNLSAKGESALVYLLELVREVPSIEDVFVDLARAFGWDEKMPIPHAVTVKPVKNVSYKAPQNKKKSGSTRYEH